MIECGLCVCGFLGCWCGLFLLVVRLLGFMFMRVVCCFLCGVELLVFTYVVAFMMWCALDIFAVRVGEFYILIMLGFWLIVVWGWVWIPANCGCYVRMPVLIWLFLRFSRVWCYGDGVCVTW